MHRVTRYGEKKKWTHLPHAMRAGVERSRSSPPSEPDAAEAADEEREEKPEEEKPERLTKSRPAQGEKKARGKKSAR